MKLGTLPIKKNHHAQILEGNRNFCIEVFDIDHLIGHHIFFLDHTEECNFNTAAPSKINE